MEFSNEDIERIQRTYNVKLILKIGIIAYYKRVEMTFVPFVGLIITDDSLAEFDKFFVTSIECVITDEEYMFEYTINKLEVNVDNKELCDFILENKKDKKFMGMAGWKEM